MRRYRAPLTLALLAASLLTGACAGTELAAHALKSAGAGQGSDRGKSGAGADYKLGEPYVVDGVAYVPRDDPFYDNVGIASWYGTEFHGRRTANGDTYDMNALTAAHTTLPMPSKVRVTNLDNGRELVVTVNDRGPFVDGRIIDVSRRAAQLLGFEKQGTAKVRVRALAEQAPADKVYAGAAPPEVTVTEARADRGEAVAAVSSRVHGDVTMAAMAPPAPAPAAQAGGGFQLIKSAAAAEPLPAVTAYYVQGGAFRDQDNAVRLERSLASFGPTRVIAVETGRQILYRVRLGPIYAPETAQSLLHRVVAAGHPGARLVAEAE